MVGGDVTHVMVTSQPSLLFHRGSSYGAGKVWSGRENQPCVLGSGSAGPGSEVVTHWRVRLAERFLVRKA